jgi:hypothetical protein
VCADHRESVARVDAGCVECVYTWSAVAQSIDIDNSLSTAKRGSYADRKVPDRRLSSDRRSVCSQRTPPDAASERPLQCFLFPRPS